MLLTNYKLRYYACKCPLHLLQSVSTTTGKTNAVLCTESDSDSMNKSVSNVSPLHHNLMKIQNVSIVVSAGL